jgi:arginine-tRNA-protein transferase
MIDKTEELFPPSTDFCTLDYDCAYLKDRSVRMHYKYTSCGNKTFNSALIQRGWRRFGNYYFYPICNGCNECKSLRINAINFKASKSQRKSIKRNKNTRVLLQETSVTNEHIKLYNKYHKFKAQKDGWRSKEISHSEYFENFADGAHDFGKEVLYYIDNKLVAVDLIDILDDGISSIYFYYDPDYARYSLGVYSLIVQIELTKMLDKKWVYLGYWVDGCKAFEYKTNFKPTEILDGFPTIETNPEWKEFEI